MCVRWSDWGELGEKEGKVEDTGRERYVLCDWFYMG